MNDNTKVLDQNPSVSPTAMGTQGSVQSNINIGSMRKEQASAVSVEPNLSEFIKPEIEKPNIDQEQKDMGVVTKSEAPDLTFEHKQIGLEHSGATVPVPPGPTGLVQFSEKKDISDSGTWLNTLTEKVQKVLKLLGV